MVLPGLNYVVNKGISRLAQAQAAAYNRPMKKLLLIGALLCGSAQAVALNTLKMEDVCINPDKFFRLGDDFGNDYSVNLPSFEAAYQKLIDYGFKAGTTCPYIIEGYSTINVFKSVNMINFTHYMTIFNSKATDKITNINVISGYIVVDGINSLSAVDLNRRQLLVWAAMFDTFLADWKASHPK